MKILHVNKFYTPVLGGIERVVQDIAEGLEKKGYTNEVLACGGKWRGGVEDINGIRVYRAGRVGMLLGMPISLSFFSLFRKRVKEADAVFLHHPFPLAFLAHLFFGRSKKLFVWYHSDIVRQRISGLLIRPMIHKVLRRANKIFVASNNLLGHSSMLRGIREKCVVIPFGIDLTKFEDTDAIRNEARAIHSRYGTPLILSVGRPVYYKGFEYLIHAMQGVDAKLLIIGSGPLERQLKNLARELKLSESVFFLPHVPSLLPYYYACDFFVLPSCEASEAFGIVQLEAMACGRTVINTNLRTGVPEVNIDGETGITVPPKDSHTLHDAILKLIGDRKLCERFSMRARERVEERFRMEKFIDALAADVETAFEKRV